MTLEAGLDMVCRNLATVSIHSVLVQVEYPNQTVLLLIPALSQVGTAANGQIVIHDHIHQSAVDIGKHGALAGNIPVHGIVIGNRRGICQRNAFPRYPVS